LHRHRAERIQQHGLADATQPRKNHAAFRPPAGDAFKHHLELADLAIAAREFRRALASSWGIRIANRVHGIGAYCLI
jgi:hypothetical protein